MPESKDFPLCGSAMQPKHSEQVVRIPGNPKETKRKVAEWIYPDCDYFEEAEDKERVTTKAGVSARRLSAELPCGGYPQTPRT